VLPGTVTYMAAVTEPQLTALQGRLEALSSAQLLTDAERWALEDVLGDLIELEATVGAVSVGLLHAHPVALQVRHVCYPCALRTTVPVASCQALAWPVSRGP
jgi:hypothetical protein